ncbi:hyaluronidase B [Anabrus simplex]|uniref:hyaluronidase B n=1 Tax=Anabrus simplex TaxID=316456 RepID=UPI0035A3056E
MNTMYVIRLALLWISTFASANSQTRDSFRVFWNVPSFACHKYGINIDVSSTWGIIQNSGDVFRGERLTILYDPGDFPALIKDSSGKFQPRNGGVPQEGNLTHHLQVLSNYVDRVVTDKNFSGLGVIDMESWRPIFRQLFGSFLPYKDYSYNIERKRHPWWIRTQIEEVAASRFESAAHEFMKDSLELIRQMRPHGQWGYYAFPYCFNTVLDYCKKDVQAENNRIQWLFDESNVLYPSIYLAEKQPQSTRVNFMRGRVAEARRVAKRTGRLQGPQIYAYVRFVYHDTLKYLSHEDIFNSINIPKQLQLNGVMIWGSSNDLNTKEKCQNLQKYVDTVLGPVVRNVTGTNNNIS